MFSYDLVAGGSGGYGMDLAFGGAVPEPSTWAMMLIGFAGLGYAAMKRAEKKPVVAGLPSDVSGNERAGSRGGVRLEFARQERSLNRVLDRGPVKCGYASS